MASIKKTAPRKARSGWVRPTERQIESANFSVQNSSSEKVQAPAYVNHSGLFHRLRTPKHGDWLDDHNETGQSFQSFQRLSMKAIPHGNCRIIELVLVGPFDPKKSPDINKLCTYVQAFFGCEVRIAEHRISLTSVSGRSSSSSGGTRRTSSVEGVGGARRGDDGQLQLDCRNIFDALACYQKMTKKTSSSTRSLDPRHVLCRVAVTMADIYCVKNGQAWNFLFGQARPSDGIGVFSFSRYCSSSEDGNIDFPLMWEGLPTNHNYQINEVIDDEKLIPATDEEEDVAFVPVSESGMIGDISSSGDSTSFQKVSQDHLRMDKLLLRSCKVLTHETGHLFGLKHCIYYECLMNGSNHDVEADSKPLHLCYLCLKKLQSSMQFDPIKRAQTLHDECYKPWGGSCWEEEAKWNEKWINTVEMKLSSPPSYAAASSFSDSQGSVFSLPQIT